MSTIKIGGKQPASKVTRAEIVSVTEKRNQVAMKKKEDEKPIEENLNRIVLEGETAHGIDEALSVLRYIFETPRPNPRNMKIGTICIYRI